MAEIFYLLSIFSISFKNEAIFGILRLSEYFSLSVCIYFLIIRNALKKHFLVYKTPLDFPIIFLIFFSLVSLYRVINIKESMFIFLKLLFCIIIYYITVNIVNNEKIIRKVVMVWFLSGFFVSLFGILVYVFPNEFRDIATYGSRLRGTFHDPNFYATSIVAEFLSVFGYLIFIGDRENRIIRLFLISLFVMLGINIVFIFSRGAIVGIIGGTLFILFRSFSKGIIKKGYYKTGIILIIMLIIFTFLIINKVNIPIMQIWKYRLSLETITTQSDQNRFDIWGWVIDIIKKNPLGVGLGNFKYVCFEVGHKMAATHNLILEVWSQLGIQGLACLIWIIIIYIKITKRILLKSSNLYLNILAESFTAAFIGVLVMGMTLDILILRSLWFIIGMNVALYNIAKSKDLKVLKIKTDFNF